MRGELTGINPAVVNTKSYKVDLLALDLSSIDSSVLLLKIKRKLRAIVTTVRFSEETKITVLILGKLGVESLEEIPDSGSCSKSGHSIVSAVAETGSNRLINV
jgi:hypothetical protein